MRHFARLLVLLLIAAVANCAPRGDPRAAYAPARIVVANEDQVRSGLGHYARALLREQRFDEIEAIAESLRASNACWPSGAPKLVSFAERGFEEVDDASQPEQWLDHLTGLRQWKDARPRSILARIALAEALIGRGWTARGSGYAKTVRKSQWDRLYSDLDEAEGILRQCPARARDNPLWYEAMLEVQHSLGDHRDSTYRALLLEAIAKFPLHHRFYANAAIHLMPRWYGGPGAMAAFTLNATRLLPDSLADEYYARVVTSQADYYSNVFTENLGLSWQHTFKGLRLWRKHWPQSTQPASALALLACMAGRPQYAREAFAQLGDTLDLDIWGTRQRYDRARTYALGQASPAR
jgi:hypothetical protein